MMEVSTVSRESLIHEVLAAEGFAIDRSETSCLKYCGNLYANKQDIEVEIYIYDSTFNKLPKLKILTPTLKKKSIAHFEAGDFYCFADVNDNVFDKYDPKGAMRSCIDMMTAALEEHLTRDMSGDIINEFPQHWIAQESVYAELDSAADRLGKLVNIENDGGKNIILVENFAERSVMGSVPINNKNAKSVSVITHHSDLIFLDGQQQPQNLSELILWADTQEEGLGKRIFGSFGYNQNTLIDRVYIQANNGIIGAELDMSTQPQKVFSRKDGFSRMLQVLKEKIPVKRLMATPIEQSQIFSRNLPDGFSNLAGKKILLVGCGTIGSHLAKMLSQSGAGVVDGKLSMLDKDTLKPGNIGRHFLGINRLGQNKAKACADELRRLYPGSNIQGIDGDFLGLIDDIKDIDLIIDATGEEALSVILNEWLKNQQKQDIDITGLFVWLVGNAAAAQAILVDENEFSCYKCLKPKHAEPARYEPRRNTADIIEVPGTCGEAPFIPYGVGGSTIAAGLACNMALDWVTDNPGPRLRTINIAQEATRLVKDVNPPVSPQCPICVGK